MKKVFINILKTVGILICSVLLYIGLGLAIPYIPVQAEVTPEPKVINGFIKTNGVHTDIVIPVKSAYIDWETKFPTKNTLSQRVDYKYIAVGWGDKGFYLDTPEWSDLKFSTAFKAAFWLGDAAIHTTYYDDIKVNNDTKSFSMTERQYKSLIKFIDDSMKKDKNGDYIHIQTDAVYGKNDAFYEAKGSYSFLYTCNTWANNALKKAGQKTAFWTLTDFGIFQHYK